MNATKDLQPALVEMFLQTSKDSTPAERIKVIARIRGMIDSKQTTTVKGEKVSVATFEEIIKRLEAN